MSGDLAGMAALQTLFQQALIPAIEAKTQAEALKAQVIHLQSELAAARRERQVLRNELDQRIDDLRIQAARIETLLESFERKQQQLMVHIGDRVDLGGVDGDAHLNTGQQVHGNMTQTNTGTEMSNGGGDSFDFGGVAGDAPVNTGIQAEQGDVTQVDQVDGDFNQAKAENGGVASIGDNNTIEVQNAFNNEPPPFEDTKDFLATVLEAFPSDPDAEDVFGPPELREDEKEVLKEFGDVVAAARGEVLKAYEPPTLEVMKEVEEKLTTGPEIIEFLQAEAAKPEEEQNKSWIGGAIKHLRNFAPTIGKCAFAFGRGALLKVIGDNPITAGVVCALDALTDDLGMDMPDSAKTGDPTGGGGYNDADWDGWLSGDSSV